MIVDLATRIWNSLDDLGPEVASAARRRTAGPWDPVAADFDRHEQAIAPLTAAAVHGLHSELLGAHIDDATIASLVARDPKRLIGFAGVDPGTEAVARDPVARLQAARDAGLAGLTVCPAASGFHPASTDAMALFEAAAEACMPVYVETGARLAQAARMEFSQPFLLDEVARSIPTLKLVIGGLGEPWFDQAVALLSKHPNVYADTSGLTQRPWQLYNALLTVHQAGLLGQVLFGSGFPFATPEQAIIGLYSVNGQFQGMPGVPREAVRGIIERDSFKVLNLPAPLVEPAEDAKSSSGFERVVLSEGGTGA